MSRAIAYGEQFSVDLVLVLSRFALPVAADVSKTAVKGVVVPMIAADADNGVALNALHGRSSVFRLTVRGTIFLTTAFLESKHILCFRLIPGEVIDATSPLLFSKSE